MTESDPFTWRAFNVLMRLLGFGATFAGTAVVTTFGLGVAAPAGGAVEIQTLTLASGALVALLGLGFLMIPAFRPDQGDTTLVVNPFRALAEPRRRRWWTGDSLPG
jgi:hypothetical protein